MWLCSPGREFPNLGEMTHGFDAASQPRRGCVIWPMFMESASADSMNMGCISSRSRRPRRRSRISMTAYSPLSFTIKEEGAPHGAPSVNH